MKTILKYSMYLLAVLGLFTLIYTLRDYIKVLDPSYINLLATIVLVIVTTIYTYQTTKHVRGDLGPKLYVTQNKIESHQKFENYAIQKEYIRVEEKREKGFSNWITDSTNWKMNLINNGKAPATEIVIKYTLKFMKMDFDYGIDQADIVNEREIEYVMVRKVWKLDYLPPGGEIGIEIYIEAHRCPSVSLIINKIYCKENTFLSHPVLLSKLYHDGFNKLVDSHESRRMIGASGPWEDEMKI